MWTYTPETIKQINTLCIILARIRFAIIYQKIFIYSLKNKRYKILYLPVYWFGHIHQKPFSKSTHCALFWHGFDSQWCSWISHLDPLNPGGQLHWNPSGPSSDKFEKKNIMKIERNSLHWILYDTYNVLQIVYASWNYLVCFLRIL